MRDLGLISGGSGKCKEPSADDNTEGSSFFMIEVPPAPTVHTSKEHDNSIVCQIELTSGAKLSISNGIQTELRVAELLLHDKSGVEFMDEGHAIEWAMKNANN